MIVDGRGWGEVARGCVRDGRFWGGDWGNFFVENRGLCVSLLSRVVGGKLGMMVNF